MLNSNSDKMKLTLPMLLNKLLMPPRVDAKMLWVPPNLIYKSPTTTSQPSTKSSLVWLLKDLLKLPHTPLWLMMNSDPPSLPSKVLSPSWEISLPKLLVSSNSLVTSTRCSPRWSRSTRLTNSLPSLPPYSKLPNSNTELATTLLNNSNYYSTNYSTTSTTLLTTPPKLKTKLSPPTNKPFLNMVLSYLPSTTPSLLWKLTFKFWVLAFPTNLKSPLKLKKRPEETDKLSNTPSICAKLSTPNTKTPPLLEMKNYLYSPSYKPSLDNKKISSVTTVTTVLTPSMNTSNNSKPPETKADKVSCN